MDAVRELKPDEFTERLMPIFDSVVARVPYPGEFINPGYFFPHWRNLMQLGIARTWEMPGDAVLGAVFAPHTFNGEKVGLINFWFKREGAPSAKPLMDVAKKVSKESGCKLLFSSEFAASNVMEPFYRGEGFEKSETVFRKVL